MMVTLTHLAAEYCCHCCYLRVPLPAVFPFALVRLVAFWMDDDMAQEYGVTSEGVFVFLDEALRNRGIDPKAGQKFTLKLTGVRARCTEKGNKRDRDRQ